MDNTINWGETATNALEARVAKGEKRLEEAKVFRDLE